MSTGYANDDILCIIRLTSCQDLSELFGVYNTAAKELGHRSVWFTEELPLHI